MPIFQQTLRSPTPEGQVTPRDVGTLPTPIGPLPVPKGPLPPLPTPDPIIGPTPNPGPTPDPIGPKQQLSDTLLEGAQLLSSNLQYSLRMQTDGNLVLYSTGSTNGRGQDFALWASGTNGQSTGPYKAVMQNDGYIILSDGNGARLWGSSRNQPGTPPYKLAMQDDGNLVVYDANNGVITATGTNGKKF